ncbi:Undecaprenyl-phosphate 4-deoxy-4-formamido-L-arabinose transferase [Rubripirellula tenax]|uniref:Undecaprenyl-phosphate 4-deoxy-4-formamido-L-arabinose transferase n=1 Tax=Rubripirellula tenax TaxID=2528015 RepID=A0A5C6FJ41_9BACT|nr:glycosyltransferase family 2 protein [Rubripirellula tenax]TWU60069.1 Undecaprenyl-phosphate 4-deoxy-4-formamido-L-arabinose transferase [Rubripirellula tenax]
MSSETGIVDLSIVVPLYNESESVGPLVAQIETALRDAEPSVGMCEIVLVDDGSHDGTYDAAVQVCQSVTTPTHVIALRRNFGQTAAMQAGIDASRGRIVATIDGDLQNDPADIPRMVRHLENNDLDLLCGRRERRQDAVVLRKIPSWIANRLISRVTGVKIHDYGCSLKIYRGEVIRDVKLVGEMHRFIPAWVAKITSPDRIGEIGVRHHARQFGQSKYGISRTFRVVLDLLSVLFFMRYRARPGHFFGSVGLVLAGIGMAMLSIVGFAKFGLGQDIGNRPMLIVGAFALCTAVQLIAIGILAEMVSRIYLELPGQGNYVIRKDFENGGYRDSGLPVNLTPFPAPVQRNAAA